MRKPLITTLLVLTSTLSVSSLQAEEPAAVRFKVSELVELPHPMAVVRQDPERFGITPEQRERFEREMRAVFPPEVHPRMQRAWELQNQVRRAVLKQGKDSQALQAELDELGTLKRELASLRIDAFRRFRGILTEEQFQQVLAASDERPAESNASAGQSR
ncbi:MAG: periplasmic heavy metal sensor [Gammaproteobacteria bacterium]|nr:periplasmic heavy metal sensor [Gammaproteobacteria bacterium]